MKKLLYFIIAVMFLSAMPEFTCAQSNDPFEQETLKARGTTTKREKKIKRKKEDETVVTPATKTEKPVVAKEKTVTANEMSISNSCDEWLDLEFVSLIGSRANQTVKLTLKMTNHSTNKEIRVGGNFLAYDCDGEEHARSYYAETYKTLTDIPVKFFLDVPGKVNPSTTKVMPVISFNVGDCRIEMRNVPINWK